MTTKIILLLGWLVAQGTQEQQCRRDLARVVRRLLEKEIQPILDEKQITFAKDCPLTSHRDVYSEQESHKYKDSQSRWTCHYCGKAFYDEKWLDLHFDNRHSEQIKQGAHVTCLADYCDVFRCDVILGQKTAKYWDVALCRDSDLKNARTKCQNLMTSCLPDTLPENEKNFLNEKLRGALCGYLDCNNYWELPPSEVSPIGTAMYTVVGVILLFALVMYYLVVYAHFFTDEPVFNINRQSGQNNFARPLQTPGDQEIRYRSTALPS